MELKPVIAKPPGAGSVVVAVPVRNEAERIGDCLRALALQGEAQADAIVLVLNNCTDATADIVRLLAPTLPVPLHPIEVALPPERAFAGAARRLAMEHAASLAGEGGVLMTTDADGRVAPDWIAANLAALRRGADAVAGRAEIDPVEALLIPAHLHADDARECAYAALLDEIAALLDPDPADPWPRHDEHSGASIAVAASAHARAGGIPAMPLAEDRGFIEALRRVDARIRHAPEVRVIVSGRIEGRAPGGMADTIRRRMVRQDALLDDRLEPARDAARRADLRARARHAWKAGFVPPALPRALQLPPAEMEALLGAEFFGAAWTALEAASPVLRRRERVSMIGLPVQAALATRLRNALRSRGAAATSADRADTRASATAGPV